MMSDNNHTNKSRKVIVIGAGASGLTAAYLCARGGAEVTLLEKNTVVGKKLSMTGNGRANLTNEYMSEECFNPEAGTLIKSLLKTYDTAAVRTLFREMGVLTRVEGEGKETYENETHGYVYPVSGEASDVVRALELAVRAQGVTVETSVQVKRVLPAFNNDVKQRASHSCRYCVAVQKMPVFDRKNVQKQPEFEETDGNEIPSENAQSVYEADVVILACGGLAGPTSCMATGDGYYMAELLGIPVTPRHPALTGLVSGDVVLHAKHGIRTVSRVRLLADEKICAQETGEVQLTNGILSGIPVMQLSRLADPLLQNGRKVRLLLDLFPDIPDQTFIELVQERLHGYTENFSPVTLGDFLLGFASSEMNALLADRFQLTPETGMRDIPTGTLQEILRTYKALSFEITGVCDFKRAQVTAGGIMTQALTSDMESIQCPGFYCIGEVVDVDGRCGGYNLHLAFMTAMAAAAHITGRCVVTEGIK